MWDVKDPLLAVRPPYTSPSDLLLQTDFFPRYHRRPVWIITKTTPNQHTTEQVDPSLADTMVTNTIVINLGTRRAPTVNKDMGSMVQVGMDKDITSWAGTYVLFEMVSRMEGSEAPCVDGAGAKTCR